MPPGGGILMGKRWEPFGVLKGAACVRTDCPFTAALESIALKCWFVRTLAAGATKIETAAGEAVVLLNTWKQIRRLTGSPFRWGRWRGSWLQAGTVSSAGYWDAWDQRCHGG